MPEPQPAVILTASVPAWVKDEVDERTPDRGRSAYVREALVARMAAENEGEWEPYADGERGRSVVGKLDSVSDGQADDPTE